MATSDNELSYLTAFPEMGWSFEIRELDTENLIIKEQNFQGHSTNSAPSSHHQGLGKHDLQTFENIKHHQHMEPKT